MSASTKRAFKDVNVGEEESTALKKTKMSASANSGDILQRGLAPQCEEAADGDILLYGCDVAADGQGRAPGRVGAQQDR